MDKVTRPFCWHQNFVPKGLSTPAPGLYTCGKALKNMYEIKSWKRLFCNLQQMVKLIRALCWHQDPKGLSAPVLGLYTCGKKNKKNVYKIRVQRNVLETFTKWAKWQGLSVDIEILWHFISQCEIWHVWMYCVYRNQAAAAYLSLLFIFLPLQFSSIKSFFHTFLRNEA